MDEIMASHLKVDPFARGVGADQDAQRLHGWIGIEPTLEILAPLGRGRAGERRNAVVGSEIVERLGELDFEPTPRVFVFREKHQTALVPPPLVSHVTAYPRRQLANARIRLVGVLAGQCQHLVDQREVRGCRGQGASRLGRLAFLRFNEYELLTNAGAVSHEVAKALAETEYEKFRVEQDRDLVSDFEKEVKRLEGESKPTKPKPAKRSGKGSA